MIFKGKHEQGFTLLEISVALLLLGMLASFCYAALIPAADGFKLLQSHRDQMMQSFDASRQLRQDVSSLAKSSQQHVFSVRLNNDNRGDTSLDECWLLVREPERTALSMVHYYVDESEEETVLTREVKIPFAREYSESVKWKIANVESFDISVMNTAKQWVENWQESPTQLPRALRIRWRDEGGDREWVMPIFLE
ncbi:MAG: type II secretion system protein [Mariprofundaceae bacterium]|nr:type II secretion system protein [Mariprofundaceae bacterium]